MEEHLLKLHRQKEKMPNYREVLELAERLITLKQQTKKQWAFLPSSMDPIKLRIHIQEGFPYLRPDEIPLNPAQIQGYFKSLLEILQEQNPKKYEALRNSITAKGFELAPFLKRFLEDRLTEDRLGKEMGKEGSLLFFFVLQSLKPAFEIHAEYWRKEQKEFSWAHGYCPFCGGYPGMGEIREEGKRILHCPLCATEWDFPRLQCPYCLNEDQEKLTYFQVEGEAGYRVDICLLCRRYLKTVDVRERAEDLNWEVEDYLTLHLDHLAQEEGYTRPEGLFVDVR
ncbi:MAG: formate dehydrogenase accessory protein FdhE [Deltaproteobacteria bacterium]|jgi:FdhE protein|nr:formate dehydrogenase accessory protein FdhE [Deltaproteobacteria bacterium]